MQKERDNLQNAFDKPKMDLYNGWSRERKKFVNYKKRAEREKNELRQRGSLDTLKSLLPVIDDFDRAFESQQDINEDHPWIEGVSIMQRRFEKLLRRFEIEAIDPTGERFDPNWHDALDRHDSNEVESGHVTVTLQKGYRAGEHLLRPALVRVAS